jgi:DNA repair exonuclease SbcCD ATPase subunit
MHLRFTNWLSYPSLNLHLKPGGMLLLAGPTGSGKSSVLDGVEFAFTGTARSLTNQKDTALLKGQPTKPMSVELTLEGQVPDWCPTQFIRGSKASFIPAERGELLEARKVMLKSCLSGWNMLRLKAGDRAAMVSELTRASIDDPTLLAELKAVGVTAPPVGTYNGGPWGGWESVEDARRQAEEIRRSYHAAATAQPSKELSEQIAEIQRQLNDLKAVDKPADRPDARDEAWYTQKFEENTAERSMFEFLQEQIQTLRKVFVAAGHEAGLAAVDEFIKTNVTEPIHWNLEARNKLQVDFKKEREDRERYARERRQFDQYFATKTRLSEEVGRLEKQATEVVNLASVSGKKRQSWDNLAKALAPDGKVAAAIAQRSAAALNRERIEWSCGELGVAVTFGTDGTLQIQRLDERLPSRGQRLLASLVMQDAVSQLAGVPVLMVDELECLDGPPLDRALAWLATVAEDYEAVLAAVTRDVAMLEIPDSCRVMVPGGGLLKEV